LLHDCLLRCGDRCITLGNELGDLRLGVGDLCLGGTALLNNSILLELFAASTEAVLKWRLEMCRELDRLACRAGHDNLGAQT
jgi:hypothetical protein